MLWKSHANCLLRKNTNFSHIITILVQFSIVNEVICRFGDFWSNFLYDFILYASNTDEFMKTVPLLTLKYHIWFGPPSGLNLDLNLTPSLSTLCNIGLQFLFSTLFLKWKTALRSYKILTNICLWEGVRLRSRLSPEGGPNQMWYFMVKSGTVFINSSVLEAYNMKSYKKLD